MEQIKCSEGVFPQQRWQGWAQRDYRESFMTDLITPSRLLCETLTPKEHSRCDGHQNLFIVRHIEITAKYQNSVKKGPFQTNRSFWLPCIQARPLNYGALPGIGTDLLSLHRHTEWEREREQSVCVKQSDSSSWKHFSDKQWSNQCLNVLTILYMMNGQVDVRRVYFSLGIDAQSVRRPDH